MKVLHEQIVVKFLSGSFVRGCSPVLVSFLNLSGNDLHHSLELPLAHRHDPVGGKPAGALQCVHGGVDLGLEVVQPDVLGGKHGLVRESHWFVHGEIPPHLLQLSVELPVDSLYLALIDLPATLLVINPLHLTVLT